MISSAISSTSWRSQICADPRPIVVGRDDHAAGPLDRLADERRHRFGPFAQNGLFQQVGRHLARRARVVRRVPGGG